MKKRLTAIIFILLQLSTIVLNASDQLSLNGTWQISTDQQQTWNPIQVPGEPMMQGVLIQHDTPFYYRTSVQIPKQFNNKKVFLQFDGVYSHAKVFINGIEVSSHIGGFTSWQVELSELVVPGEQIELVIEVIDPIDEVSYASGYAKHPVGGILRDVWLVAKPNVHFQNVKVETDFDENYLDAKLQLDVQLNSDRNLTIEIALSDDETEVDLRQTRYPISNGQSSISIPVTTPKHWTAEHPNLYKLTLQLMDDTEVIQQKELNIGFREIEVAGTRLLVNGKPVKLRGACRHDIHPLLGRMTTSKEDKADVILAKEANINFIRTSHYPPSKTFIEQCDKLGIYVQAENAVCFVHAWRDPYYKTSDLADPNFSDHYVSQMKEMVTLFQNNPSVIMWSTGNESQYNEGIGKSYDWTHNYDPTRPVMFSYPGTVPEEEHPKWEILSMHYPRLDGYRKQQGMTVHDFQHPDYPVLWDEWVHVPCYNNPTLQSDPGERDSWGQSLDKFWQIAFEKEGVLGGAIWGFVDETFMLPNNIEDMGDSWGITYKGKIPAEFKNKTIGYGEWGIIDTWRRKKPEFWNTKKAYSPVRFLKTNFPEYESGNISIPIHNRFDHSNLNELQLHIGDVELTGPEIEPHKKGEVIIPAQIVSNQNELKVDVFHQDLLVDSYRLTIGKRQSKMDSTTEILSAPKIHQANDQLIISVGKNEFQFSKINGHFKQIKNGSLVILDAPYINLRTRPGIPPKANNGKQIVDYPKNWKFETLTHSSHADHVDVIVSGTYLEGSVTFEYTIQSDGSLNLDYELKNIVEVRQSNLTKGEQSETEGFLGSTIASNNDVIREQGLIFKLPCHYHQINWKKEAYWSNYPKNHIGSLEGSCNLRGKIAPIKRQKPSSEWSKDTQSTYYNTLERGDRQNSKLTNIARSSHDHIQNLELVGEVDFKLTSDGTQSTRIADNKTNNSSYDLFINKHLDYVNIGWGNYTKNIPVSCSYKDQISIKSN